MSDLARTSAEIEHEIARRAAAHERSGSRWPGMTYEEGVDAALRWVTGESDDAPMEDE